MLFSSGRVLSSSDRVYFVVVFFGPCVLPLVFSSSAVCTFFSVIFFGPCVLCSVLSSDCVYFLMVFSFVLIQYLLFEIKTPNTNIFFLLVMLAETEGRNE